MKVNHAGCDPLPRAVDDFHSGSVLDAFFDPGNGRAFNEDICLERDRLVGLVVESNDQSTFEKI